MKREREEEEEKKEVKDCFDSLLTHGASKAHEGKHRGKILPLGVDVVAGRKALHLNWSDKDKKRERGREREGGREREEGRGRKREQINKDASFPAK